MQRNMLFLGKDWPYLGVAAATCKSADASFHDKNTYMKVNKYEHIFNHSMAPNDLKLLIAKQPVTTGIAVDDTFSLYSSGVFNSDDCNSA